MLMSHKCDFFEKEMSKEPLHDSHPMVLLVSTTFGVAVKDGCELFRTLRKSQPSASYDRRAGVSFAGYEYMSISSLS